MNCLRTAVALAMAGLAVSACSAAPAHRSSAPPPSPSPSPSASAGVPTTTVTSGSMTVIRMGSYEQEFGTPLPLDAVQAQVITSFRDARVLWFQSLIAGSASPQVKQYIVGTALAALIKAVRQESLGGIEPSGRDLLFDIRVTGLAKNVAAVATCDYDAHVVSTYRSTGKLVPGSTPPVLQDYQWQTWHLVRELKHWALVSYSVAVLPSPAARQCQLSAR